MLGTVDMTKEYSVSLLNLGCPKNQVDGEHILGNLLQHGFKHIPNPAEAEIIILNTCSFVEDAKQETIETLFNLHQFKKQGNCRLLIAAGCFSERYGPSVAQEFPEVDAFIPLSQSNNIPQFIYRLLKETGKHADKEPVRFFPKKRFSAYLKISDGCDNRCSYCAIPLIRGGYKSRSEKDILREAEVLEKAGVRELILIGQDTTMYGYKDGQTGLDRLLKHIIHGTSFPWIRVMYTHPAHWSDNLIACIAEEKRICNYIDLPIQHIADPVLKKMGRRIDAGGIKSLISSLREKIPDITLRTTAIVGFPGETKKDFSALYDFIREIEFDRMGAFGYSREEDTLAYNFPKHVKPAVIQKRLDLLMTEQKRIMKNKNKLKIGKQIPVLVEVSRDDKEYPLAGRSPADAPEVDGLVYIRDSETVKPGDIIEARIEKSDEYDLYAKLADS